VKTRLSALNWPATLALASLAIATVATSCTFNVFDPIDSPSGDAQLISAARAALDRGDFDEAVEYYQKLSGDSADIKASEQAFAILTKHNLGMAAFASAFGTGGGSAGKGITRMANSIGGGANADARVELFQAFEQTKSITSAPLKGLVRFLTSVALVAEAIAETSAIPGTSAASDIVLTPASCPGSSSTDTTCLALTACGQPAHSGSLARGGTSAFDLTAATADTVRAQGATLSLISGAINQITIALRDEIGSSGNLSGSLSGFSGAVAEAALGTTPDGNCFRAALISQGIGSN
jgi:hypothetical protein